MSTILPFKALRPNPDKVKEIASLPYDVMSSDEARELVKDNQNSFLRVIKAEVDLDTDVDVHSEQVYQKAAENLRLYEDKGLLEREEQPVFFLYQQTMNGHTQTGLVGVASVQEYLDGKIKKHEFTRPVKVDDRVALMEQVQAQTGPVFLAYRQNDDMKTLFQEVLSSSEKIYDFKSFHDVHHVLYRISDLDLQTRIEKAVRDLNALYIADGHHRSEGASVYCQRRRGEGKDSELGLHNFFLTVTFPHSDLFVLPYNRAVQDLNGLSEADLLAKISEKFDVEKVQGEFLGVDRVRTFGMYLGGDWFMLTAKDSVVDLSDPVKSLDVALLQDNVLGPLLGIDDPRTNDRVSFIGGIRGNQELVNLVDSKEFAVAFSMYPTSMDQVMDVADDGQVMPPKSTWFEPKLLSGLFVYDLKENS